jgi:putative endonuclease
MFSVYAIYNEIADKIYIGQTRDVSGRVELHNCRVFKGYTSRFRGEWKVIYTESFSTRAEALLREKQLKSYKGREFIKTHIPE